MTIYPDTIKTNLSIGASLVAAAKIHATKNGIGSFSEYVARLIVADLRKRGSAAKEVTRFLKHDEKRAISIYRISAKPRKAAK